MLLCQQTWIGIFQESSNYASKSVYFLNAFRNPISGLTLHLWTSPGPSCAITPPNLAQSWVFQAGEGHALSLCEPALCLLDLPKRVTAFQSCRLFWNLLLYYMIKVNLAECVQRQVNHFKQHNRQHTSIILLSHLHCFKQTRFNRTLAL